jgi:hypothetical protein
MNLDKFKDEHCCNDFCSYYGLQPFSPETGLKDDPTSEGKSFLKNPIGFDRATKGKGGLSLMTTILNRDRSDDDFVDIEQKWKDGAASTSTEGGYTKCQWTDLSLCISNTLEHLKSNLLQEVQVERCTCNSLLHASEQTSHDACMTHDYGTTTTTISLPPPPCQQTQPQGLVASRAPGFF